MAYMKDSTGRRLDHFRVAPVRKPRIVLFGDSRTADCNVSTALNAYTTNMDWFGWGNYSRTGGPTLDVVRNAGISGNTTTQMLARMQTDVIAHAPDYMTLWGGTNDGWSSTASVDATIGRIVQMLDLAAAAGIYVFLISECTSNFAGYSANFPKWVAYFNDVMRRTVAARSGVEFWDFNSEIVNPANASGFPKAAMYRDGLHFSAFGASTIGKRVVAPALARLPWNLTNLLSSQIDNKTAAAESFNVLSRGLMLGTGGTLGGSWTGQLPDGWSGSGNTNIAASVVSRTDGFGNDMRLVLSPGSSSSVFVGSTISSAHMIPGAQYVIEASLAVDASVDLSNVSLTLVQTVSGQAYRFGIGYPTQTVQAGDTVATGEYTLRSAPITVPAGTVTGTEIVLRLGPASSAVAATVRLGRVSIKRVS